MENEQPLKNVTRVGQGPRHSNWNIPNALTTIRLILVPVFIALMLQEGAGFRWAALAVFVVAGYTDRLDGKIARARGIITDFGRLADPIADKALTLGAFIMLCVVNLLPWWFAMIIAIRELGITWMRAILVRRKIVVAANWFGKWKTVLQMGLIAFLLVPWGLPELPAGEGGIPAAVTWIQVVLAAVVLAITIYSGLVYVLEGLQLWRASEPSSAASSASSEVAHTELAPAQTLEKATSTDAHPDEIVFEGGETETKSALSSQKRGGRHA